MTQKPPTNCDQWAEMVSAYFDNQLEPEHVQALEDHLAQCPRCRKRIADYEKIHQAITAQKIPPPGELADGLIARFERRHLLTGFENLVPKPTPRTTKMLKALALAAMVALVASATLIITRLGWPPTQTRQDRQPTAQESPLSLAKVDREDQTESPPTIRADAQDTIEAKRKYNQRAEIVAGPKDEPQSRERSAGVIAELAEPAYLAGLGKTIDEKDAEELSGRRPDSRPSYGDPLTIRRKAAGAAGRALALPAPRAAITLNARDPAAWMILRDELITTFKHAGLARISPDQAARQLRLVQPDAEFFCLVPRRDGPATTTYQSRFLLAVQTDRIDQLTDAIRRIHTTLPGIASQITMDLDRDRSKPQTLVWQGRPRRSARVTLRHKTEIATKPRKVGKFMQPATAPTTRTAEMAHPVFLIVNLRIHATSADISTRPTSTNQTTTP